MDYYLAIDPQLEIYAHEFARAWNADTEHGKLARAGVMRAGLQGFPLDPALIRDGLLVLGAFAGGITADVLKDLLKDWLKKMLAEKFPDRPAPGVDVTILDHHGHALLVVKKGG
ncbi:hypothetical protein CSB45_11185 [candidate division KSB3 bacterium]|uniref:Uncharacterized protein n=1 Tax=candidate division KSB3 bacterium TaxID=2044937 RepID=A0A2G6E3A7_9BACT|nr:MAG: hypothetical protein CSB45_11185 [candidate division KSB3 bacterium]PIE29029.1 MAG: hypothetical protein CSA57_10420 [candidate division KSB3 bacterium]